MITNLELRNFKCFRSFGSQLGDLTILAGLNGMGKSTVIQSLLVLRQSFARPSRLRTLRLSGELIDLGTGSDVLFEAADSDEIKISFELAVPDVPSKGRYDFTFDYDRTANELRRRSFSRSGYFFLQDRNSGQWRPWLVSDDGPDLRRRIETPLLQERGFQYLCAERLGPRKVLPLSDEQAGQRDLGKQGEFVLQYLLTYGGHVLNEDDPRVFEGAAKHTLLDQCVAWLQETSPGTRLDIDVVRAADAALARYSFERRGDVPTMAMRPVNVGFGLSYVLPVLVSMISAKPGDLIIIENPEAHLHPRGQTGLGQLAARTAAAGVQVIIETHSDHFMDGVRIDVRQEKLSPEKVKFLYFEREGSETSVKNPEIDANGRLNHWPPGFFDQRDENLLQLI